MRSIARLDIAGTPCNHRRPDFAAMFSRLKTLLAAGPTANADGVAAKKDGDEHLKHDRWSDAEACYRRALAANPDYVDALVGLGFALSEQKKPEEAERELR